jgi:hypothetical protein
VLRTACVFLLIFFVVSILFILLHMFLPGGGPSPSGMGTLTLRLRLLNGEAIIALIVASVFARRYWRSASLKRVRKPLDRGQVEEQDAVVPPVLGNVTWRRRGLSGPRVSGISVIAYGCVVRPEHVQRNLAAKFVWSHPSAARYRRGPVTREQAGDCLLFAAEG